MAAETSGMSARRTTTAPASSETAATPARREVFMPRAWSGFTTLRTVRPESSRSTRSASCPRTTATGSRPAARAVRAARRTSDSPSNERSSLFRPRRAERPAARTTPGMPGPASAGMDRPFLLAQRPGRARSADREQLRHDRERDLLRALRPEVEADRGEDALAGPGADLRKDLGPARPRTEETHVGNAGL